MREVKSDDARRGFRDLLDDVQRDPAAPVRILRYDKPVAVLVGADWYRRIDEAHHFTLDMAQIVCPDCQADSFPGNMGEAVAWMLGHECANSDEREQDHG